MRTERPPFRRSALSAATMALALSVPAGEALALFKLDTNFSGTALHDSNLFRIGDNVAPPGPSGQRDDTIYIGAASLQLEEKIGEQRLYVRGEGAHYAYDEYKSLERNEYDGAGGLDWKINDVIDGSLAVRQGRHLVPLEARLTPSLDPDMQTNREASAGLNLNVTPSWRLETRGGWLEQDSPSPAVFFHMEERSYAIGGKYLGLGEVATGLEIELTDGTFTAPPYPVPGLPPPPPGTLVTTEYSQLEELLTVDYKVSGMSTLQAKIGAAQRRIDNDPNADSSAFTGELEYKRTISAMTKVTAGVFSRLRSYPSFDDYVIETGGSGQVEWQPTHKLYFSVFAQYLKDSFNSVDRSDSLALLDAGMRYQMFEHFSIKPSYRYEDRSSSDGAFDFTDQIYGVEARVNF